MSIFGLIGSILGIGGGSSTPQPTPPQLLDPSSEALQQSQANVLNAQAQQIAIQTQLQEYNALRPSQGLNLTQVDAFVAQYKMPILLGGGALVLLTVMRK